MSGCLTVSMVNFRPPTGFYLPITVVTTNPVGFFLLGPWREMKHRGSTSAVGHSKAEETWLYSFIWKVTFENTSCELIVTESLTAERSCLFTELSCAGRWKKILLVHKKRINMILCFLFIVCPSCNIYVKFWNRAMYAGASCTIRSLQIQLDIESYWKQDGYFCTWCATNRNVFSS